jgi:hypothetical protein
MDCLFYYIANTKVPEISIEIIKTLLAKGADIYWQTLYKENVLHVAVIRKTSVEVIRVLVEKGSDVNSQDYYGYTPLMKAVIHKNNLLTIKYLLEKGADINARNDLGYTPVMIALQARVLEAFTIFKNYYVDLTVVAKDGKSCRDIAYKIYKSSDNSEIKEILLSLGFDFSSDNDVARNEKAQQPSFQFGKDLNIFCKFNEYLLPPEEDDE